MQSIVLNLLSFQCNNLKKSADEWMEDGKEKTGWKSCSYICYFRRDFLADKFNVVLIHSSYSTLHTPPSPSFNFITQRKSDCEMKIIS